MEINCKPADTAYGITEKLRRLVCQIPRIAGNSWMFTANRYVLGLFFLDGDIIVESNRVEDRFEVVIAVLAFCLRHPDRG